MLTISDSAAAALKRRLSDVTDPDEPRIRFGVVEGSVQMAVDQERPGDTTVEHEGAALVVMDPATSSQLDERQLDIDEATSALVLR